MPLRTPNILTRSAAVRRLAVERLEPRLALSTQGVVYLDANLNGVRDGRDVPASNAFIYEDANYSGAFDAGEFVVFSGQDGRYFFPFRPPPNYPLALKPDPGYQLTSPLSPSLTQATSSLGLGYFGLATGHFNADRHLDLLVFNDGANTLSALLNNGAGGFTSTPAVPVSGLPSITVADFDNDGDDDVALGSLSSVSVLRNNGGGQFTPVAVPGVAGTSVVAADFNGDSRVDLAVLNSSTELLSILISTAGPGVSFTAQTPVTVPGGGLLFATHVNADATPDLVSVVSEQLQSDYSLTVTTFVVDGAAALSQTNRATTIEEGYFVDASVGDVNGDGIGDLVTNTDGIWFDIRIGNGTGAFVPFSGFLISITSSFELIDYDQDRDLDFVGLEAFEGGLTGELSVVSNLGDGRFGGATEPDIGNLSGGQPETLAYGDFNNDGTVDFALAWTPSGAPDTRLRLFSTTLVPSGYTTALGSTERDYLVARAVPNKSQGDYDGDGAVTAADFFVWHANLGKTAGPGLAADGDDNGRVEGADFLLWQRRFGAVVAGADVSATAVADTNYSDSSAAAWSEPDAWLDPAAFTTATRLSNSPNRTQLLGDSPRGLPPDAGRNEASTRQRPDFDLVRSSLRPSTPTAAAPLARGRDAFFQWPALAVQAIDAAFEDLL